MKPVTQYLEYRDFLHDFFQEKKNNNPWFSFRYAGNKLQIDASHIVKILQKQRHISNKDIDTFIGFCGLQGMSAKYFAGLVNFNKAKSDREIKLYYEHLLSLKGIQTYTLEKKQYAFYQKWYHTAILTLLDFFPFEGNYKALAAKLSPPITESQARKAINLLTELELIRKDENGQVVLTNKIITCGEQCRSIAVKTFQDETLRLALESLYRHKTEERNISTVTITLSKEDLPEINEMIKRFRSSLLNFAEEKVNPDRVYQLNIQIFPLTE